jgi:predicted DNA-binding transcriptional regulator AlpA
MSQPSSLTTESDALTLYDLAERWGVSYSTVHDLARRDALPVPVFRVGRKTS